MKVRWENILPVGGLLRRGGVLEDRGAVVKGSVADLRVAIDSSEMVLLSVQILLERGFGALLERLLASGEGREGVWRRLRVAQPGLSVELCRERKLLRLATAEASSKRLFSKSCQV